MSVFDSIDFEAALLAASIWASTLKFNHLTFALETRFLGFVSLAASAKSPFHFILQ